MDLFSYREILVMSKEKVEEALAPSRAKKAKALFDGKAAELEGEKISAEQKVIEACAKKDMHIDALLTALDDVAILERRIKQINDLRAQLFPVE